MLGNVKIVSGENQIFYDLMVYSGGEVSVKLLLNQPSLIWATLTTSIQRW